MGRRKRSIVPPPCCTQSEEKGITCDDTPCEPELPTSPCDQKPVETECTNLAEDPSCPEPTSPECQRYYCKAICGKKQVLAFTGSAMQTVSCTTIRPKPKKKGAYSTLHGLPQELSACSPTCGSPLRTSPGTRTCRIPLHYSPCARRRLPLQFTSCNTLSDPCPTLCSNTCNGQCNTPSGPFCAQPSGPQSYTFGDEPLVMTAYLPITIKLCQATCTCSSPCTCVSPCKSPTCSHCCQKCL